MHSNYLPILWPEFMRIDYPDCDSLAPPLRLCALDWLSPDARPLSLLFWLSETFLFLDEPFYRFVELGGIGPYLLALIPFWLMFIWAVGIVEFVCFIDVYSKNVL